MVVFAMFTVALMLAPRAWAGGKMRVLYSFKGGSDGKYPTYPGLVFDKAGNLYGTTFDGGKHGLGTVFELKRHSDGSWGEVVLHSFDGGHDGAFPNAGLVFDDAGSLYGATPFGGGLGRCSFEGAKGCGTVFELRPGGNGQWTETVLRRFDARAYGGYLKNNLILDDAGNLYGTAEGGGGCPHYSCGIVFELAPAARGSWKERILYSFHGSDGDDPSGPLLFDARGNLYGTTIGGGSADEGAVFRLEPANSGPWKETVLHSFTPQNHDGSRPCGFLAFDAEGNIYGSTQNGGKYPCDGPGCGIVYELAHDTWAETILHYFNGHHVHNFQGISDDTQGVAFDTSGNLYGTAAGTELYPAGIFELIPQKGGTWKTQIIYQFAGHSPFPGMAVYGKDGNMYGMTFFGGTDDLGTVFRLTP
jgi:uncharacterized repeat protein (TIGR03803 family)